MKKVITQQASQPLNWEDKSKLIFEKIIINESYVDISGLLNDADITLEDIAYALCNINDLSPIIIPNIVRSLKISIALKKEDLSKYNDFILSFVQNNSSDFKPEFIQFKSFDYSLPYLSKYTFLKNLYIQTGIQIIVKREYHRLSEGDLRELKLAREFYLNITKYNNDNPSIDPVSLIEMIHEACNKACSPDGYPTDYHKAVKILFNLDLSQLAELPNVNMDSEEIKIQDFLLKQYIEQKIIGEIYSVKHYDNLYFNMVKVTEANVQEWKKYSHNQSRLASKHQDNIKKEYQTIINQIEVGLIGFDASLSFYDNDKTEVWVAYASYVPVTDPNEVNLSEIEMFVTISTSQNSPFTSHMGITRSATSLLADKEVHRDLATHLHTFAAQVMLKRYPQKKYMINIPMREMRDILCRAFESKNMQNALYISDDKTKYSGNTIEQLLNAEKALEPKYKEVMKLSYDRLNITATFHDTRLERRLLQQQDAIKKSENFKPVLIEYLNNEAEGRNKDCTFILIDKENNELCRLDRNLQQGEYAWFFQHAHQFESRSGTEPMVIVDLNKLATLKNIEINNINMEAREDSLFNLKKQAKLQEEERVRLQAEQRKAQEEAERQIQAELQRQQEEKRVHLEAERQKQSELQRQQEEKRVHLEAERQKQAELQRQQEEKRVHLEAEQRKVQEEAERQIQAELQREQAEKRALLEDQQIKAQEEAERHKQAELQRQQEEERARLEAERQRQAELQREQARKRVHLQAEQRKAQEEAELQRQQAEKRVPSEAEPQRQTVLQREQVETKQKRKNITKLDKSYFQRLKEFVNKIFNYNKATQLAGKIILGCLCLAGITLGLVILYYGAKKISPNTVSNIQQKIGSYLPTAPVLSKVINKAKSFATRMDSQAKEYIGHNIR
ncbi:coiled-coil domain-containing protein [Rickettsiales endosymbiont of Stachyamoeba lipophora]|uniref:hypothetical protein n=1 Tax=Rickettsiales endosymbiont of Stachyamoeba lipophora TaxID=2486578 RepID=UPI000F64A027|nr:hypothetical protein [Rickettsiales endosymbiont of Stachyamoeba lipophora]AZL16378.1 hypothetical protein EF513_07555 [Rickettsiales endosymbiont of Stachyamoeba lipophora]